MLISLDPRMPTLPPLPQDPPRIHVRGIVQGVGFRPVVYKLAESLKLTGSSSTPPPGDHRSSGQHCRFREFIRRLELEAPQLAEVTELAVSERRSWGTRFEIIRSRVELVSSPCLDRCWYLRRVLGGISETLLLFLFGCNSNL